MTLVKFRDGVIVDIETGNTFYGPSAIDQAVKMSIVGACENDSVRHTDHQIGPAFWAWLETASMKFEAAK